MRTLLPSIRSIELSNLLLCMFLLQSILSQEMRWSGQGPTVLLDGFVAVCCLAAILAQLLDWRRRQRPNYWMRLPRRPRAPFPLAHDGTPIYE
jgi:hypothetical protein